jgi:hypothetical protein
MGHHLATSLSPEGTLYPAMANARDRQDPELTTRPDRRSGEPLGEPLSRERTGVRVAEHG